jgi:hypothetical protein
MISEKGILPVGIEKDGVWHREFEIRPALVKDTIEVSGEQDVEKLGNKWFAGMCLTAKQIVRIGSISPILAADVMEMLDTDLDEINAAKERLAARLCTFHRDREAVEIAERAALPAASGESSEADPGDAKTPLPAAGDSGNDGQ